MQACGSTRIGTHAQSTHVHACTSARAQGASLAIAGAVEDNKCAMTNLSWLIDGPSLQQHFGFKWVASSLPYCAPSTSSATLAAPEGFAAGAPTRRLTHLMNSAGHWRAPSRLPAALALSRAALPSAPVMPGCLNPKGSCHTPKGSHPPKGSCHPQGQVPPS